MEAHVQGKQTVEKSNAITIDFISIFIVDYLYASLMILDEIGCNNSIIL